MRINRTRRGYRVLSQSDSETLEPDQTMLSESSESGKIWLAKGFLLDRLQAAQLIGVLEYWFKAGVLPDEIQDTDKPISSQGDALEWIMACHLPEVDAIARSRVGPFHEACRFRISDHLNGMICLNGAFCWYQNTKHRI